MRVQGRGGVRAVALAVIGLIAGCASSGGAGPGSDVGGAGGAEGETTPATPSEVLAASLALQGDLYDVLEAHADDPDAAAAAVDAFARAHGAAIAANKADGARMTADDTVADFAAIMRLRRATEALQWRGERYARRAPGVISAPAVVAAVERAGLRLVEPRPGAHALWPSWLEPDPGAAAAEAPPDAAEPPWDAEDAARFRRHVSIVTWTCGMMASWRGDDGEVAAVGLRDVGSRREAFAALTARRERLGASDPAAWGALLAAHARDVASWERCWTGLHAARPGLAAEPAMRAMMAVLEGRSADAEP